MKRMWRRFYFLSFFELSEKLSKRRLSGFEFIFFDNTFKLFAQEGII